MKLRVIFAIVLAQFLCTSLWFVGNVIIGDVLSNSSMDSAQLGYALISVQIGFIVGTFIFAILAINDRFSSSGVFMVAAISGALTNLLLLLPNSTFITVIVIRFITGFCLAGIYPVGMKIASDYYQKGLGKALGYLVGALVLGTAFPHLVQYFSISGSYHVIVYITSGLALVGGLVIGIGVPEGPYSKRSLAFTIKQIPRIFIDPEFKRPVIGYFGHMWELYAFWGWVPVLIIAYNKYTGATLSVSLWSFISIAIGSVSCSLGGILSNTYGSKKVALWSLIGSGICCAIIPLSFLFSPVLFLLLIIAWGFLVIADSPQFSTLIAQNAPLDLKGTALTMINCIGYSITIISIQVLQVLSEFVPLPFILVLLGIGPVIGIFMLYDR